MGATSTNIQRVDRILNLAAPKDRFAALEDKIRNLCTYFDRENETIKEELNVLKEVVFNRVLTPTEASVALNIKPSGVRKNLELGNLDGFKDGGRWKTTIKALYEYMLRKPNKYGTDLKLMDVVKFYSEKQ